MQERNQDQCSTAKNDVKQRARRIMRRACFLWYGNAGSLSCYVSDSIPLQNISGEGNLQIMKNVVDKSIETAYVGFVSIHRHTRKEGIMITVRFNLNSVGSNLIRCSRFTLPDCLCWFDHFFRRQRVTDSLPFFRK